MVRHLFSHSSRTAFFFNSLCVMRDSLLSFTSRSLLMLLLFCKANSLLNGILKNIPQCLCFHVKIVLTWKPCKSFQGMCMFEVKRERSIERRIYLTVHLTIYFGSSRHCWILKDTSKVSVWIPLYITFPTFVISICIRIKKERQQWNQSLIRPATQFTGNKNRDVCAHTEQLRIHTTYQDHTKYTLKSRSH